MKNIRHFKFDTSLKKVGTWIIKGWEIRWIEKKQLERHFEIN